MSKQYQGKSYTEKQEEVKEALKEIHDGVTNIFQQEGFNERFKEFLDTMSKFHNYSVNNQLMIMMQKPEATQVAGFNTWKNNFNRTVIKGEKSIKILAPCPYKTTVKDENGNPVLDENGKEKQEQRMWFKLVPVFDVSQTEGEPIKGLSFLNELQGEDLRAKALIEAIKNVTDCEVSYGNTGSAKGYFSQDLNGENRKIVLSDKIEQMQEAKTIAHEYAHSELHRVGGELREQSKAEKEITAEATAYAISKHFGLDTSDYTFGYVWSWNNAETKDLKVVLDEIQKHISELIDKIEPEFDKIMERELDKDEIALSIGDTYLFMQKGTEVFDYTIYDKNFSLVDGGILDAAEFKNVFEASQEIIHSEDFKGAMKLVAPEKLQEKIEMAIEQKKPMNLHQESKKKNKDIER